VHEMLALQVLELYDSWWQTCWLSWTLAWEGEGNVRFERRVLKTGTKDIQWCARLN
jgi:hypothetical protein